MRGEIETVYRLFFHLFHPSIPREGSILLEGLVGGDRSLCFTFFSLISLISMRNRYVDDSCVLGSSSSLSLRLVIVVCYLIGKLVLVSSFGIC